MFTISLLIKMGKSILQEKLLENLRKKKGGFSVTIKEFQPLLWDDFVCDLPGIKFAVYPGLEMRNYISATTDINGDTDLPLQNFKDADALLNNFKVNGKPLKEIIPLIDITALT